jgi:hypothetical protein
MPTFDKSFIEFLTFGHLTCHIWMFKLTLAFCENFQKKKIFFWWIFFNNLDWFSRDNHGLPSTLKINLSCSINQRKTNKLIKITAHVPSQKCLTLLTLSITISMRLNLTGLTMLTLKLGQCRQKDVKIRLVKYLALHHFIHIFYRALLNGWEVMAV